jgi:hypothetical protein
MFALEINVWDCWNLCWLVSALPFLLTDAVFAWLLELPTEVLWLVVPSDL